MASTVSLRGELGVVDDVPRAFSALVVEEAPASLALSGGSTARASYELLAVADVDWSEVDVFFGDERWVPIGDPESNEGVARHAFLDQVHPRAVTFDAIEMLLAPLTLTASTTMATSSPPTTGGGMLNRRKNLIRRTSHSPRSSTGNARMIGSQAELLMPF